MRLLTVNATGQVSGAERVLLRLLAAGRARGWDVACACPDGPMAEEAARAGVRVVRLPELGLARGPVLVSRAVTLGRWTRAAVRLRAASRGADVVLTNSLLGLPALRLASPRPPVAWLAHDVVVRHDRLQLYRACRGVLAHVVAVSQAVAAQLETVTEGGPPVTVVANGVNFPVDPSVAYVDGASSDPARVALDRLTVGLNGVLTSWKGHHDLLDAVALLPHCVGDADVRYELMGGVLGGDEAYADGVRARAGEPALAGRVEVIGHVSDPLARMRTWDVAVSASTSPEAGPLSVLEAMSLGVPVVATDHGGAPEVLGGHGLLYPPGDVASLAETLRRLLADPALRHELGAAGRRHVARHHRADAQQERLLDAVAAVAGHTPVTPLGTHREGPHAPDAPDLSAPGAGVREEPAS